MEIVRLAWETQQRLHILQFNPHTWKTDKLKRPSMVAHTFNLTRGNLKVTGQSGLYGESISKQ